MTISVLGTIRYKGLKEGDFDKLGNLLTICQNFTNQIYDNIVQYTEI